MTIDEQLGYLTKGCVDVVRLAELRAKLERFATTGKPLTGAQQKILDCMSAIWLMRTVPQFISPLPVSGQDPAPPPDSEVQFKRGVIAYAGAEVIVHFSNGRLELDPGTAGVSGALWRSLSDRARTMVQDAIDGTRQAIKLAAGSSEEPAFEGAVITYVGHIEELARRGTEFIVTSGLLCSPMTADASKQMVR